MTLLSPLTTMTVTARGRPRKWATGNRRARHEKSNEQTDVDAVGRRATFLPTRGILALGIRMRLRNNEKPLTRPTRVR